LLLDLLHEYTQPTGEERGLKRVIVRKDSYYDSVFLMLISTDVNKIDGVADAVVAMGTEMNVDLISDMGLDTEEVKASTANDLIIAIDGANEGVLDAAAEAVDRLLNEKKGAGAESSYRPGSLAAAVENIPGANMVIISLPGQYAAREARRALNNDLHVMMFSDNVSLEEEVSLKKLAVERGLLMMGPDCGTAIVNGLPLCFSNVVPKGPIGMVSASGTGLQEVACAIAKAGSGVSQALGTGGRDLKKAEVGGMMMNLCIEALGADPETKVITVVSKPPLPELMAPVIAALKKTGKPSVVHFVGTGAREPDGSIRFAGSLEAAAKMAVAVASGSPFEPTEFDVSDEEIEAIVARETAQMAPGQKYLRGLFTGGTLTDESATLLYDALGGIHSFDAADPAFKLKDPHSSQGHTIVDLGEDVFTVGRPHPMIDPSIRTERMDREAQDPEMALMLLDCVIGYGSHADPAGAMVPSIEKARKAAFDRGGYLCVVASVTGTDGDFQGLGAQRRKLEAAGVVVMPTNYQATMLVRRIMERGAAK
jgi:succinyl-CoA synthetase alpha subunit